MTNHRLDPLLAPDSIALLGASSRNGTPGHVLADMVINSSFSGRIYPINPRYPTLLEKPCYADLNALPETVDHVVIAVGNKNLEQALQDVIAHGAKAATIYSSGVLAEEGESNLKRRLSEMASAAGLSICGANGMGFYNVAQDLYAGIFSKSRNIVKGSISIIAQSGSAFAALCHNGCRLGFNLCVSSGDEMTTSVSDYMDWALEQQETRVIALFLETIRKPEGFVQALQKANSKNIPVVSLKVGRSPLAAKMAMTHTGAIAGNHAAYEALFRKYGVIEAHDFDEMAAILMLLQYGQETGAGSLAAVFESGGFRELFTDLAHKNQVEFAPIEASTKAELEKHLDPGLLAENPLDAWGSPDRFEERFHACLRALMQDPNVAMGVFVSNFRDGYFLSEAIYRVVEDISKKISKPLVLSNCYSDLENEELCKRAQNAGVPVIDGLNETLFACKHLFSYRKFKRVRHLPKIIKTLDQELIKKHKDFIRRHGSDSLGESDALRILSDFSIETVEHSLTSTREDVIQSARRFGYPLVLKTAKPGIHHKSDSNGVFVNISSEEDLVQKYDELCDRIGPEALLSKMIDQGVEISLGVFNDPQFGPVVMVAAGGILVEIMADRAVAMCPVNEQEAEDLINSLHAARLLDGIRGKQPSNKQALSRAIVGLSEFAYEFRDCIEEIDINPVLVNSDAAIAVDALIVRKA